MSQKITFTLSAEVVADADSALLLGEFNNWNESDAIVLKKQKDGSFKATASLEPGTYHYRYLLSDGRWVNDANADQYTHAHGFSVDNCVITVSEETTAAETEKPVAAPKAKTAKAKAETTPKEPKAAKPDDLTKIEGIGKKIAELLVAENIVSFADLSKSTPKALQAILDAAGNKFKIHNPGTWPKQAKLAATGKWDELKTLQAELKGGK